jgi:hypothetical protein
VGGALLRGLLLADVRRKNVEAMALRLLGAGPLPAPSVLSRSSSMRAPAMTLPSWLLIRPWSSRAWAKMTPSCSLMVVMCLSKAQLVGVARQWFGASGKTANCQVGVFLGYASRRGYTLLDRRCTFMPRGSPKIITSSGKCAPSRMGCASRPSWSWPQRWWSSCRSTGVCERWLVCDEGYDQDLPCWITRVQDL